jgi:deazaflavin-dependent oxidoreductase (nitroreductase family)
MANKEPRPFTASEEKIGSVAVQLMSKANTWLYRASGGKWGAKFTHGAPVFLLITTGRKSGEPRTAPLIYLRDGSDYILVASKGGMSKHPAWYLNLEATPECEIEIGKERLAMIARRVSDEEKADLWPRLLKVYPDYDDYQARTERNIPVLRLTRR